MSSTLKVFSRNVCITAPFPQPYINNQKTLLWNIGINCDQCSFFINFDNCVHEGFPAPHVLLCSYYSCLNFAMLGVAMLKDVPREICIWNRSTL